MSSFEERLAKRLEDPEFAAAWKETELEYLVARNIIKKRKALGLTQNELAKRIKTQQSVISRIEAGNSNITLKTLGDIAKALDTDVSKLTSIDESSNNELAVASV